jgi:hypothetical protein
VQRGHQVTRNFRRSYSDFDRTVDSAVALLRNIGDHVFSR